MVRESRDIFEVIATRHSTKFFAPRPVEMDKVLQVIQAGTLAPSSGNIQNWSFTIVTDVDKIRDLYNHTLNQEPFLSAPMAIIVCGDVEYAHTMYGMRGKRLYTIQNCAAAIENMLLAAHALDLGAIWIGAFDEDKVALMFDIPSHQHRPQAIVLLGYPDEHNPAEEKETKPLNSVVYFNAFGNKVLRPHLIMYDWATEWRLQGQKIRGHFTHVAQKVIPPESKNTQNSDSNREPGHDQEHSNNSSNDPHHAAQRKNSFELAKQRIRESIDSLKKEQYRKK